MAPKGVENGRSEELSTLMKLVGKASDDLHSQTGRIADNLTLVRNFGNTLVNNGITDDRRYLVSVVMRAALHSSSLTLHSTKASFNWQHHFPTTPDFVMI